MSNKYNGTYPTAWSARDISVYEELGKEPAKTTNGLWVSDVEREARDLSQWSMAELYALANNELMTQYASGDDVFYRALRTKALLEHRDALKWGEEDLYDWLMYEKTPARSPGGHFINDPDRWVKDAALWDDSELSDLGAGYFGELERNHYYILDEACERFGLPIGITWDEYCAYIQRKVEPELTSTGVLMNDRRRALKDLDEWTEAELKAYALGEIEVDSKDQALLERAIETFGGEWYWDRLSLMVWVKHGEIPDFIHDYDSYSEAKLKRLIRENNDQGAFDCLASYHLSEMDYTWWNEEQRRAYLLDGIVPESPVVEEEVIEDEPEAEVADEDGRTGTVVQPEVEELEEPSEDPEPELGDGGTGEAVPEVEPQSMVWTDLVEEGSELFDALSIGTSQALIADDEHRQFLTASKWSMGELIAWARDLIPAGMNSTPSTLVTALRRLCDAITPNWTDDAVKAFFGRLELPEGLETGMLVHDAVRDRKHPGDWSDDELKAWVKGDIRSAHTVQDVWFSVRVHYRVPDWLTEDQARDFILTGTLPAEEVPPIVAGQTVSDKQLQAWLKGELTIDDTVDESVLFAIARQRYKIDVHWTDAHILAWIRNKTEPRALDDGILVEDRLRDLSTPTNWSWKELRALALGLIDADFEVTSEATINRIRRLIDVQFGVSPAHWSDEEVLTYVKTQTVPKALENGVYINDPTRHRKQASEWRDVELKAWLKGEIDATVSATEEDLWEEIYVRFKVPVFWYREDARSYVLDRVMVPSTLSGIYVRDRNRDARRAQHWTRREVKAWCRGQILPGIHANAEQLLERAKTLFGISHYLDADAVKKRVSDITEESMTMTVKFVDEDLKSYEAGRTEAGDNTDKAAAYQSLLDRCINRVLRLDGEDFVQGWTELLNFFHKNSKGICSAKKIYTGVGKMSITPKGLRTFQNMTAILTNTCDPSTRDRSVNMIDWNAALKDVVNEKARQNLLHYYGK